MIQLLNIDCMEYMATCKDKQFDLAIVDPPYGLGIDGQKESICKNPKHNRKEHKRKGWDNAIPTAEYFRELERVSKNQIIWGANYFVEHLNKGTKGWIFWYKGQEGLTMSDGEIAYSSFQVATRMINLNRGLISQKGGSIHPTQKPVKLYEWLLCNYGLCDCCENEGYGLCMKKSGRIKILDTHLGSASSAIACHNLKFDFVGCEIDKEYFEAANKRFKDQTAQIQIFQ